MGLVTSWELLDAVDVGPGEAEGTRRMKLSVAAHGPGDDIRLSEASVEVTPELFDEWLDWVRGRVIRP